MRSVELALRDYLQAHNLSAYRLAEAARGRVSRGTVYALARGDVQRLDLGTLGAVITTLEELTGGDVTAADLLRTVTVTAEPDNSAEWLAAPLMPDLPPYDWGPAGEPEVEPVRYVPGAGFVAGSA
jgi:hypothetical protein